jgi:hypothetical protein
MWNKREKAHLILIFNTNTNHESVAYPRPEETHAWAIRGLMTQTKSKRVRKNIPCPFGWGQRHYLSVGDLGLSGSSR